MQDGNRFLLEGVFSNLAQLTLSPWPLQLDAECTVAACLPSLLHTSAHVPGSLVHAFTQLKHARSVSMILKNTTDDQLAEQQEAIRVDIDASNDLQLLVLVATPNWACAGQNTYGCEQAQS